MIDPSRSIALAADGPEKKSKLLTLYELAREIALADARVTRGLSSGEFAVSYYPLRGQELSPAALGLTLTRDDYLVSNFRNLGDVIAKGTPLVEVFAELLNRETGTSKGRGGGMHISDPRSGVMATTGVVGSGAPIAVGLATSSVIRDDGRVTAVTFGDGATSIGAVHEAMNLASLWRLPVVFACQNNQYGEATPQIEYTRTAQLAKRAAAYEMCGETVDGTDGAAVLEATTQAVERARNGEGPTFLEIVTFRLQGHYFGDSADYMDQSRLTEARQHPAVTKFREQLLEQRVLSESTAETIDTRLKAAIDSALAQALAAAPTPASELTTDVFAPSYYESGSFPA